MKKSKILATSGLVLAGTLTIGNFVFAGNGLSFLPLAAPASTAATDESPISPELPGGASFFSFKSENGEHGWGLRSRIGGLDLDVGAIVAEALGMTSEEVAAALESNGQNILGLLEESGALEKAREIVTAKVNEAVANGKITQEQADGFLANVDALFDFGVKIAVGHGAGGFPETRGNESRQTRDFGINVDVNAIAKEILGVTDEEYEALLDQYDSLRDMLTDKGILDQVKQRITSEITDGAGTIADAIIDGANRVFKSGGRGAPHSFSFGGFTIPEGFEIPEWFALPEGFEIPEMFNFGAFPGFNANPNATDPSAAQTTDADEL